MLHRAYRCGRALQTCRCIKHRKGGPWHTLLPASLTQHRPVHLSKSFRAPADLAPNTHQHHDEPTDSHARSLEKVLKLPVYCPGCGAPSQTVSTKEAGFYTVSQHRLKKYFREAAKFNSDEGVDMVVDGIEKAPNCDRCHNLLNHTVGDPIYHPSIESIHDIILESPHERNHIYHILDAADLPMSLISTLQKDLKLPRLRTQNRRSKHTAYSQSRVAEVSFIITRADLLAPDKEHVDSMLPYLREVIRDALGRSGRENVRLGNVRCVSAHRGWWTSKVKEEIWERGGAGWMVGKVNVGKSSLFEATFPKGRGVLVRNAREEEKRARLEHQRLHFENQDSFTPSQEEVPEDDELYADEEVLLKESDEGLLPPARQETAYPNMPISSSLPGTTASPIRIPYGHGRGELIDLPGVSRATLDELVAPAHRRHLVMQHRVKADKYVIKSGQSLILAGGLIRITPRDPETVILAHPFVQVPVHVTSTLKAEALAKGDRDVSAIPGGDMPLPGATKSLRHALSLPLKWDVTRARAGPLTSKEVGKRKPQSLPFTVWSADLLIEGVGWVELVAQTRRAAGTQSENLQSGAAEGRNRGEKVAADVDAHPFPETMSGEEMQAEEERASRHQAQDISTPCVDIFSPNGKHVGYRRPMGAYALGGRGQGRRKVTGGARPRRSVASGRTARGKV